MEPTGRYTCRSRPDLHFGPTWNGIGTPHDFTSLVVLVDLWPTVCADAIPLFRLESLLDRRRPIEKQTLLSGPSSCGRPYLSSFLLSNRPEYVHNGVGFPRSAWRSGRHRHARTHAKTYFSPSISVSRTPKTVQFKNSLTIVYCFRLEMASVPTFQQTLTSTIFAPWISTPKHLESVYLESSAPLVMNNYWLSLFSSQITCRELRRSGFGQGWDVREDGWNWNEHCPSELFTWFLRISRKYHRVRPYGCQKFGR